MYMQEQLLFVAVVVSTLHQPKPFLVCGNIPANDEFRDAEMHMVLQP